MIHFLETILELLYLLDKITFFSEMIYMCMSDKNRDMSMDMLRIVLCLMVIGTHVISAGNSIVEYKSSQWNVLLFVNCAVHYCVPPFFMLSGAFSRVNNAAQAIKKASYFLIIFLLASIFYYFFDSVISDKSITFWGFIYGVYNYKYHLWFLLNMATVTLLSPFLNDINENNLKYSLILMLVFLILFKNLTYFFSLVEPIKIYAELVGEIIPSSLLFCGYYLCGKYLHLKKELLKNRKSIFLIMLLVSTVANFFVNKYAYYFLGIQNETFLSPYNIFIFIQAVCIFSIFLDINIEENITVYIYAIKDKVFSIYIIHVAIIDILTRFGITPARFLSYKTSTAALSFIFILIEILFVFFISYIFSIPLSKLGKAIKKTINSFS